ncbi:MAG: BA14K family protein [Rhizobiaceae bacterium]|nr:BA14K family protein [Rhizobiaceae bacterium]
MNYLFKAAILSVAVSATTLAALPASAGERYRRHHGGGHDSYDRHYSGDNDLVVAGILGLAAGALAVGLASQQQSAPVSDNPYRKPRPRPIREYPQSAYYYEGGLEPWSRGWYEYCSDRYRSFDPESGTFVGYDGREHFCIAD